MEGLKDIYFFRGFDPEEMAILRSITRITEASEDDVIIRHGQESENLFIVRTGSVRVVVPFADERDVPSNPEQTLVNLGPGECFGEFAFVDRQPASASVIANTDSTLYAIWHRDLDTKLLCQPATAAKFYKALLEVVVRRIRNTDLELAIRRAVG